MFKYSITNAVRNITKTLPYGGNGFYIMISKITKEQQIDLVDTKLIQMDMLFTKQTLIYYRLKLQKNYKNLKKLFYIILL